MNKELAQMVLMTALRERIELGNLMPILKEHGEGEDVETIRAAIGSVIYETGLLIDQIFAQFPDLEKEYEDRRCRYGRPYY